jgi:hypothetical protein
MLSAVAGIPGILALIVCMRSGPQRALVRVYLPTLLLLPTYFHWTFTLHLGFSETAIIPIAAVFIARSWNNWRWSLTDFLVLGLVAIMIVSQYVNSGYSMAQNLAIHGICNVILPYVLAKGMLHDEQLRVDFVKTVVILLAFIAITSIYEFRMTPDPYKILPAFFFPGQFDAFAQRRYNLTRIAGPFPHAILCGMMLAGAYWFARWLEWTGSWPGKVPFLPISKVKFCQLAIFGGCLMTISRGPWLGAIVAIVVVWLCMSRDKRALAINAFVLALAAVPIFWAASSYVSVTRDQSASETQETAAYRHELIQKYIVIAEERPIWGWGFTDDPGGGQAFPILDGMKSIDNHYLLLALEHGEFALALMVAILIWTPLRLLIYAERRAYGDPDGLLAFVLLGVYITFAVSIATVWLGGQTQPMLFLVAGWSEGLLLVPSRVRQTMTQSVASPIPYKFERVMA